MSRIKLSYSDLDGIIQNLFEEIQNNFKPEIIIHPGIRTDYLIKKAEEFFNIKPYIIDNSRNIPFKKIGRKLFYDLFDYVPNFIAEKVVDGYIKIVHSEKQKPVVNEKDVEKIPLFSSALILDDVFCSGNTVKSVMDSLENLSNGEIRIGTLVYTPNNNKAPNYFGVQGKYSLPWRNIGI